MSAMKEAFEKADSKVQKVVKNANLFLRVPTIKKVETIAVEQKVIDKAVANARQYLADIPDHMTGLVARIRGIRSASPEERAICSSELKNLEDEVMVHLDSEDELLGGAARQAYALAMVSTLPPDKRVVMETIKGNSNSHLPGLLGLKILEPVGDAKNVFTVKVYGDTYKVGGSRDFATKLAENLSAGAAHAAKAAHEFYHGEVEGLKAQATVSVAEMMARKYGCFFLDVPDLKDGGRFLPGGALLAESDGRVIRVLQACGHFQKIILEIAESGVFVPINSLNQKWLELEKRPSEEKLRLARILHAVLRRGIVHCFQPQLKLVVS